MLLLFDVGNTHVTLGGYDGSRCLFTGRIATDRRRTEDEYAMTLESVLHMHGYSPKDVEDGIVSSVVPVVTQALDKAFQLLWHKRMMAVTTAMDLGLEIRTDTPELLGKDLIVDAVGAKSKYPCPILIFDLGTATTCSVIDESGVYRGGMIAPGLGISVDALGARTAQLPYVSLDEPSQLIGTNTKNCIRSGIMYGHAGMIDGFIDRMTDEIGRPCTSVITGGLASKIAPLCRRPIILDERLLFEGLLILYKRNRNCPRG
ncbi:MAG: type III pantothenate kinase [Pyramidobacter sp.]|jgi:type III pantothenate kinase